MKLLFVMTGTPRGARGFFQLSMATTCGHLSARLHSHPRGSLIFLAVSRVMVWWNLEHWVDAKPSLSSPVNMTEPPHCVEYMLNSVIYCCYFFYVDDSFWLYICMTCLSIYAPPFVAVVRCDHAWRTDHASFCIL